MKKLFITVLVLFTVNLASFSQVEKVAKEILTAYKNKDADLLKKHASGIMKFAISPAYFTDKSVAENVKAAENWNGEIKEIRYTSESIQGNKITMAAVYFADAADPTEIYVVNLSNTDGTNWVMFASGISTMEKSEFESWQKDLNSKESVSSSKPAKDFNIEMASGDKFEKAGVSKLVECINKLDDDNFYVIVSYKDDYMQAAFSEDNSYTVEYGENGVHYSASDVLTKDQTISIFKKYMTGDDSWKTDTGWEKD